MNPEQDAFGQILLDIYSGENPDAAEIIERDDGFIQASETAQNYFDSYEDWSNQIQDGIEHAHGSILDIGCGAGRHSLYLQENGFDVRGIDVSDKAIKVAEERGLQRTSIAGIDDVSSLPEESYDTIILLGNNLGLLGSNPVERLRLLSEVSSEDATLIGQTREATTTEASYHTQYHAYNEARGRRPGCLRLRVRYQLYKSPWHNYLFINKQKLRDVVAKTPWSVKELYQYGDDAEYTIVLSKESS